MAGEVCRSADADGVNILGRHLLLGGPLPASAGEAAAVQFHGADGGVHHDAVGRDPTRCSLDVDRLFRSHVGAEARLCDDIVGDRESEFVSDDAGVSVCYVGERSCVDEGGVAFERLNQIGQKRFSEEQ